MISSWLKDPPLTRKVYALIFNKYEFNNLIKGINDELTRVCNVTMLASHIHIYKLTWSATSSQNLRSSQYFTIHGQ